MLRKHLSASGAAFREAGGLRLVVLFCICLGICLSVCTGCSGRAHEPVLETYSAVSSTGQKNSEAGNTAASDSPEKEAAEGTGVSTVTVHVCGAVKKEGVYTLPAGARIRDAVEAAGGFSGEADTDYLNLAMEMADAWQIRVPTKEEAEALRADCVPEELYGAGPAADRARALVKDGGDRQPGPESEAAGSTAAADDLAPDGSQKVDLNTAGKEELMRVPGIGETRAQRILDYREKNGGFEKIEDLMNVSGIKEATFQKLRDYIRVGETALR